MKKIIGYLLLLLPFVAIGALAISLIGVLPTVAAFAITGLTVAIVFLGAGIAM